MTRTSRRAILATLVLSLVVVNTCSSAPSQQFDKKRLDEKLRKIDELVPKWVAAGGDRSRVLPLGNKLKERIKAGDPRGAEEMMDAILAIVEGTEAAPRSGRASQVKVRVYDSDGRSVPRSELTVKFEDPGMIKGVFALDIDFEAVPSSVASVENGMVTLSDSIPSPMVLHFFPRVEGFGQVKVYADNGGRGYAKPSSGPLEIDLPLEALRSRIANTDAILKGLASSSIRAETRDRLAGAKRKLADATQGRTVEAGAVYEGLADALWAGEMAAVDAARAAIAKRGSRRGVHFGVFTEGFDKWNANVKTLLSSVFNAATVGAFFLSTYEPSRGKAKPELAEAEANWLHSNGFYAKGHPLVYLIDPSIPRWLKGKDFEVFKDAMRTRILRDVARFKGKIRAWDIINEAHMPNKAYTQDQIVELARVAAEATKQADPDAVRVVNITIATGDYLAVPGVDAMARSGHTQSPYSFLKALERAGVDYDAIGMQLYYPSLDMMELSRIIDKYAKLGKPIHITELGVSSATGKDSKSQVYGRFDFSKTLGEWHHPWDEETQADWVEQFFTIAYAKPSVTAIIYTHVTDTFWPHGGLFHDDLSPKTAFVRLQQLIGSWRVPSATLIKRGAVR